MNIESSKSFHSKDAPKKKKSRHNFSKDEDSKLLQLVNQYGKNCWNIVAQYMEGLTARQCRERYQDYLMPGIKNESWTPEEEQLLEQKVYQHGKKWTTILKYFPSRTDVNLKNHWSIMTQRRNKSQRLQDKEVFLNQLDYATKQKYPQNLHGVVAPNQQQIPYMIPQAPLNSTTSYPLAQPVAMLPQQATIISANSNMSNPNAPVTHFITVPSVVSPTLIPANAMICHSPTVIISNSNAEQNQSMQQEPIKQENQQLASTILPVDMQTKQIVNLPTLTSPNTILAPSPVTIIGAIVSPTMKCVSGSPIYAIAGRPLNSNSNQPSATTNVQTTETDPFAPVPTTIDPIDNLALEYSINIKNL